MKILSATQFGELDKYTIDASSITSLDLMEKAAKALYTEIASHYSRTHKIILFAGPGNNGGDALALARILTKADYKTETFLFNIKGELSQDCSSNKIALQETPNAIFHEIQDQFTPPEIDETTIIIDGLFGIGINKPLVGGFGALVKWINQADCPILSIDMPSGLMCEDNSYNIQSHIIHADYTFTFQLPKLSFFFAENQKFIGELKILDIDLSKKKIKEIETDYHILEFEQIQKLLRKRPNFSHKGTFGHGLLIAGQFGMAGCAILAAKACMKSGIGKLTIHTPYLNNNILQTTIPEAILHHDKNESFWTSFVKPQAYSAIAIGPGIGTNKETEMAFIQQLNHSNAPLVLDADSINILGNYPAWLKQIPEKSILTPHPGELQKLTSCRGTGFNLLQTAQEFAKDYQCFMILKGHYTAICLPNGKIYFNPTGNSGMATAGSGDVLTGILLGLLASGYKQTEAAKLGVYLHGIAGDLASKKLGEESVTASDIVAMIPCAFLELKKSIKNK